MSSHIDVQDNRTAHAVEILAESPSWIHCWLKRPEDQARYRSEKAYGIASQTQPGKFYLTNAHWCSCEDQRRHPTAVCKHRTAVRLLLTVVNASRTRTRSRSLRGH